MLFTLLKCLLGLLKGSSRCGFGQFSIAAFVADEEMQAEVPDVKLPNLPVDSGFHLQDVLQAESEGRDKTPGASTCQANDVLCSEGS